MDGEPDLHLQVVEASVSSGPGVTNAERVPVNERIAKILRSLREAHGNLEECKKREQLLVQTCKELETKLCDEPQLEYLPLSSNGVKLDANSINDDSDETEEDKIMTLTRKLERMREKYRMEQATSKALREALEEVTLRESKNSDTIEQMRRDYKNLEKMMESCQSSKAVIESTLKSLRQELNAAVDRIKLEGNFAADLHAQSQELVNAIREREDIIQKKIAQVNALNEAKSILSEQLKEAKEKEALLLKDNETQRVEIEALKHANSSWEETSARTLEAMMNATQQQKKLEELLEEYKVTNGELEGKIQELVLEMNELKLREPIREAEPQEKTEIIANNDDSLRELTAKVKLMEEEIHNHLQKYDVLLEQNVKLESSEKRLKAEISKLENKIQSLNSELTNLLASRAEIIEAKASLQKKIEGLEKEKEIMAINVMETGAQIEELQYALQQSQAEANALREQVNNLQKPANNRRGRKPSIPAQSEASITLTKTPNKGGRPRLSQKPQQIHLVIENVPQPDQEADSELEPFQNGEGPVVEEIASSVAEDDDALFDYLFNNRPIPPPPRSTLSRNATTTQKQITFGPTASSKQPKSLTTAHANSGPIVARKPETPQKRTLITLDQDPNDVQGPKRRRLDNSPPGQPHFTFSKSAVTNPSPNILSSTVQSLRSSQNGISSAVSSLSASFSKSINTPSVDESKLPACCPVPACGVMLTCIVCGDIYHSSCLNMQSIDPDEFKCTNCQT